MSDRSVLAVYPGSFDPITYGHIDVIKRSMAIFPNLVVAVVGNPYKQSLFDFSERVDMIRSVIGDNKNIKIDTFNGLLIDYVCSINAKVVIRGLRAISDFEYEFQMALSNNKLNSDIETLFMMSSAQYSYVSSKLIKEIAQLGGDISAFVPGSVADKLYQKLKKLNGK